MRAKKLLTSRQIFRYAVPARTVTKKALTLKLFESDTHNTDRNHSLAGCLCLLYTLYSRTIAFESMLLSKTKQLSIVVA